MEFDEHFRAELHRLFIWRRDVRHFRTTPLPPDTLERLIETACLSPSVGFSQPWRFVIVADPARRQAVIDEFKRCNRHALESYSGDLAATYAKLKLAGLEDAPGHLAVFTEHDTETGHGLGRMTMPETIEYSAVAAVHTLWLAARAEGIGVGWVSILEPARIGEILEVPADWRLIGYLCIGYPEAEQDTPELERAGWERRRSGRDLILFR